MGEDKKQMERRLMDKVKELETSLKTALETGLKENKRLMDREKELETSLAIKTKESVKASEDKKQMERRLMDKVKELETSLATKTLECGKMSEDMGQLEEDKGQLKDERKYLEKERKAVDEMKTKVGEEKVKVEEEKIKVKKERVEAAEEMLKVKEEKIKVEKERVKVEEERSRVERMSEEQQKLVKCLACHKLPREDKPVPCCPQGHFVCSPCMDGSAWQDCPACLVPVGQGQSLLALTVVKNAQHECRLQGCNVSLPFDEIKEHEEKCAWRLVICPGSGATCTVMVPFWTVMNHVQNCPNCVWPPKQYDAGMHSDYQTMDKARAYDGRCVNWKTEILQLDQGLVFFVRLSRKGDIFLIDVVMKGTKEDCKELMVEASILDAASRKSMFKAIFQPRPLTNQNEAVYCLSVPEKGVSQVWKYDVLKETYQIDYLVKVVKVD